MITSPARSGISVAVRPLLAILVLLGTGAPNPVEGQVRGGTGDEFPSRINVGLAVGIAQPLGEFSEYVSVGAGLHGFLRIGLDDGGSVGLRIDGGVLTYGNETQRVCLSETVGCRIQVDLTTSNNILLLGIGPEFGTRVGSSRLYGAGTLGLGYFSTDSRVAGTGEAEPFASTRNYGDGGLSWTLLGGIEIPLGLVQGSTVALDLGASYHRNGLREYLTRGAITERPDGSLQFDVTRSEADFLLWRLGVSVGVGPGHSGG
jgi:hypothetical protein